MEYDESMLVQRIGEMKLFPETESSHMTLHCAHCNTVLGDSYGICGDFSIKHMDSIMCLKVTDDVVISDPMESGHKGDLANCICSALKCRVCCCDVGKVIHSAPSHLATIRSLFLLYKAKISCYILDSSSMVRASKLTFHMKPLREHINEVRQQVEAQLNQMSHANSRLTSVTSDLNK
ncbi:protein Mis18-beta [Mastacembelus armatus]|uniref:Opa interacting protein 5 n=1 Tax=Mastacembelus armatus TaxID=205130 RepID=A0A3Q3KHZ1_9TELE|nr:protein Mis18-beta-like [Mastacembelus armatus]